MLAGTILFVAALVAIVNVVADLLAYLTDPRERPARQKRSRVTTDVATQQRPARVDAPVVEQV
jgi:hypothetical protein